MGIALLAITLALALFVRRQWPGLVWLGLIAAADIGALILLPEGDPRTDGLLAHVLINIIVYGAVRAIRRWKEPDDGQTWAVAAWQIGAIATAVNLTFFDGAKYTWWNWIVIVPLNLFLAEIWPIYWLILRPIFG